MNGNTSIKRNIGKGNKIEPEADIPKGVQSRPGNRHYSHKKIVNQLKQISCTVTNNATGMIIKSIVPTQKKIQDGTKK